MAAAAETSCINMSEGGRVSSLVSPSIPQRPWCCCPNTRVTLNGPLHSPPQTVTLWPVRHSPGSSVCCPLIPPMEDAWRQLHSKFSSSLIGNPLVILADSSLLLCSGLVSWFEEMPGVRRRYAGIVLCFSKIAGSSALPQVCLCVKMCWRADPHVVFWPLAVCAFWLECQAFGPGAGALMCGTTQRRGGGVWRGRLASRAVFQQDSAPDK